MTKKKLPKISIITPSYNQYNFIEETIKSVLNQNYPNLEYIIVDGGSTDGTLEILKKYGDDFIWISEKDKGQTDAINKGLKKSTGDIVAYLNSDDVYTSGTLSRIANFFQKNENMWITGRCNVINEEGEAVRSLVSIWKNFWQNNIFDQELKLNILLILNYISQPATFWRRELLEQIGFLDTALQYTMDYEYWLRIMKKHPPGIIDSNLASFRIHPHSKGIVFTRSQFEEGYLVASLHTKSVLLRFLHKIHDFITLKMYHNFNKYD